LAKQGIQEKLGKQIVLQENVIEINSQLSVSQLLGIVFYVSNRFLLFFVMLMAKVSKVHGEDKMLE